MARDVYKLRVWNSTRTEHTWIKCRSINVPSVRTVDRFDYANTNLMKSSFADANNCFPYLENEGDRQYFDNGDYFTLSRIEYQTDSTTGAVTTVWYVGFDTHRGAHYNPFTVVRRYERGLLSPTIHNYKSCISLINYGLNDADYCIKNNSFAPRTSYFSIYGCDMDYDKDFIGTWKYDNSDTYGITGGSLVYDDSVSDIMQVYQDITLLVNTEIEGEDAGPTSGEGGQDVEYSTDSDTITDDVVVDANGNITNVSNIISSGFARLYKMTPAQLVELADYLYTPSLIAELWEKLTKIFIKPLDSIIAINSINFSAAGTAGTVKVCGRNTGVDATVLGYQYIEVDCGTVQVPKQYASALDYSPFTKVSCYLPFVGSVTLNTDDVMGKNVNIKYNVDLVTGSCVAKVIVEGSILYTFSGNCASQIPLTGADSKEIIASLIGAATAVAAVASKGATTIATTAVASGVNVMNSKEVITRGGSCVSANGALNVKKPYFTFTRPIQSLPQNFHQFKGYTSNITSRLGNLRGYTEIRYVHVDGINATESELMEIDSLLHSGIII